MNKQIILLYYLRDVPEKHKAFQVLEHTDGVQTVDFYFVAPQYDKPLPSDGDMQALEADALAWHEQQKLMTYDALFKLLSRSLRAKAQMLKQSLIDSEDEEDKVSGYMLSELERGFVTGDIYNNADVTQRAEFDSIRALFVEGGVLTQFQADVWGSLQEVSE